MAKKRKNDRSVTQPSWNRWVRAVRKEARLLGINPHPVLYKDRCPINALARARAWKRVLQNQKYSVAGVARTSGHDHTTVLSALLNMKRIRDRAMKQRARQREIARRKAARENVPTPKPKPPVALPVVNREIAMRDAWRASLRLGRFGVANPLSVWGTEP